MHTSVHSGGTGIIRHSPRSGFNSLFRALPGDHRLVATVTPEKLASQELSACFGAPGPHDFAVRIRHVRLTCPPRPPHPRPTYRDDRPKRPSSSRRDAREHRFDLPDGASADACDRLPRIISKLSDLPLSSEVSRKLLDFPLPFFSV